MRQRKAFALFEVSSIGLLLSTAMIFTIASMRRSADRAVCAANLRGLGQAIAMYSEENRNQSPAIKPAASPWGTTWNAPAEQDANIDALAAQANDRGSNIQHYWLLVHSGIVPHGQFVCPSDVRQEPFQVQPARRFGFATWRNVSYGLPPATRHADNRGYIGAPRQAGTVVWAGDRAPQGERAQEYVTDNHRGGGNFLQANYAVLWRTAIANIGWQDDDVYTVARQGANLPTHENDSFLAWMDQPPPAEEAEQREP